MSIHTKNLAICAEIGWGEVGWGVGVEFLSLYDRGRSKDIKELQYGQFKF
jgi:hypothetical protein